VLARTQRQASATAAIADSVCFARAIGIGYLVHKAVIFGSLDNFKSFFTRYLPPVRM
jgi:hypothetical protein